MGTWIPLLCVPIKTNSGQVIATEGLSFCVKNTFMGHSVLEEALNDKNSSHLGTHVLVDMKPG